MSARTVGLALFGCAVALAACQSPGPAVSLPEGPQVIEVEMADNRFVYEPPRIAGRVLFRVQNTGKANHSLSLLALTDDIPPIDEQLRGTERRTIVPLAAIKARAPGTRSTTFAADLASGARYAMVCFVTDAGGSHALLGMTSEFRIAAEPAGEGTSSTGG